MVAKATRTRTCGFCVWCRTSKPKSALRPNASLGQVASLRPNSLASSGTIELSTRSNDMIWQDVSEQFTKVVGSDSYHNIMQDSIKSLSQVINAMETQLQSSRKPKFLEKCRQILPFVEVITSVVNTIAPYNPEILPLIRNGISMAMELAGRDEKQLEIITVRFLEIKIVTTKFESWISEFADSKEICQAIKDCMIEVIFFCGDAINQMTKNTLLAPPRAHFESVLNDRVQKIRRHSQRVYTMVDYECTRLTGRLTRVPSPPKDYRSMPRPQNLNFIGREDTISLMTTRAGLSRDTPPINSKKGSMLLHGLGGIGKTELAAQFCYTYWTSFKWILWFSADTEEKLKVTASEYITNVQGLPKDTALDNPGREFRKWLQNNEDWLVVFDNAESYDLLASYWPLLMTGVVIVTSRNPDVGYSLVEPESILKVTKMTEGDGKRILQRSTANNQQESLDDSDAAALCLYELADGLPLILTTLAGFVRQRDSTLTEALQIFQSSSDFLNLKESSNSRKGVLRNVWAVNLSKTSFMEGQVLDVLAFLDPDAIPEALIQRLFESSIMAKSGAIEFLDTLRGLRPFSFIQRSNGLLFIHRLVQEVLIDLMSPETRKSVFNKTVGLLHAVFPQQSKAGLLMSDHWDNCARYFTHIVSLERRFNQLPVELAEPITFAQVLFDCSWYLFEKGFFDSSVHLATTCSNICNGLAVECRLLLADAVTVLGGVFIEQGKLQDSYDHLMRACELRESAIGSGLMESDHPQIANSYMSLGAAAVSCNRVSEGIELALRSIEIRWKQPSCQLQMLAMSYNNLGLAYLTDNKPKKALEALQRCVQIVHGSEGSLDSNHILAMETRTLYNLGNTYLALGDQTKAVEEHHKAMAVRRAYFGDDHHNTACSQYKLGVIAEKNGNEGRAAQYYRESYQKLKKQRSNFGTMYARSLLKAGRLYIRQGSTKMGSNLIKQAEESFRLSTGKDLRPEDELNDLQKSLHPFFW